MITNSQNMILPNWKSYQIVIEKDNNRIEIQNFRKIMNNLRFRVGDVGPDGLSYQEIICTGEQEFDPLWDNDKKRGRSAKVDIIASMINSALLLEITKLGGTQGIVCMTWDNIKEDNVWDAFKWYHNGELMNDGSIRNQIKGWFNVGIVAIDSIPLAGIGSENNFRLVMNE